MRIAIFSNNYLPRVSGVAVAVYNGLGLWGAVGVIAIGVVVGNAVELIVPSPAEKEPEEDRDDDHELWTAP